MKKLIMIVFGVALCSLLFGAAEYRVEKKISIPGDYGWDYLTADTEGRRDRVHSAYCTRSKPYCRSTRTSQGEIAIPLARVRYR